MIRFGIIGTANITHRFIKGLNYVEDAKCDAIASRSLEKAINYTEKYPSMKAYGSIKELLQDPNIDAVYIATPNYTHCELVKMALQHGKHVLCEKPMMLNEQQVHECFETAKANHCVLMEAMKPCFLPTTHQAIKWIKENKIGKVQWIEASNCGNDLTPFLEGWHSKLHLGGGALYDIGVYPLAFVNNIHPLPIKKITALSRKLASGIDSMTMVQIAYEDGVLAHIRCAIDTTDENLAVIHGEKGTITIKNFWKSDTAYLKTSTSEEIFQEEHNQSEFRYQIASFIETIKNNQLQNIYMDEHASAKNAWVIDQIIRGEKR